MSATPPDGSRPSRKLKVRTGCITCKIRKVKCDEEKPFCKRCTDTGRKCDGYAVQPDKKLVETTTNKSGSPPCPAAPRRLSPPVAIVSRAVRRLAPATLMNDAAFLSPALSSECEPWVEFFSTRTGPALSNIISHSFWSFTLPQLSVSEPVIRHALIAVGSAHARFEAEASNNQLAQSAVTHKFTLRHYNEAIRLLQKHLSSDPKATDLTLLCCLMFISLECIYGNRTLVIDHLQNGLNLLRSSQLLDQETEASSNAIAKSIKQEIRPLLHRLDSQTTLMGFPGSNMYNDTDSLLSLHTPRSFDDFEHAKISLDTLVASTLHFIRSVHDGKHDENGTVTLSARTLQLHLLSELSVWNNSMANLVKSYNPFKDEDNRMEKMLRIQQTAACIWLSRCTELEEQGFDVYLPEFASIVKWARTLATPSPDAEDCLHTRLASLSMAKTSRFSLNMAYIPPLYLVAIKCRDPITRREAISLLDETNGREGLWDARLHAKVARRLVEVEEATVLIYEGAKSAYMEDGPLMRMIADGEVRTPKGPMDERFRIHDMDIRDVSEGSRGTCNIIWRTAPHGVLGEWSTWTEVLYF
ncbi:hypothetical protein E4T39_03128 [Aureobasidium subglaciale]|nr:hypothetical protein E4T39_03128 [Aureobasidium subglaciale]